jgi:4-amino-4-deoxy-L-arabinose transferase-like glycosyltransferase
MNMPDPSIRLLLIAAALSFLPMLNLYYVGEEAIFPITSMEMAQHGVWLKQYLYGSDVQHNPLFNWLIIPLANLAGWPHVLLVARGLTVAATLATAAVLAWLAWRLFRDRRFAAFAALVHLTFADVLMYRGWLAYVDPLFALFVFSAIAILWVACAESRPALLWLAAAALTCALLSKAFTAYVFYGAAFVALAGHRDYRRMLLGFPSLAAHAAMLLAPLLWFAAIPSGHSQSGRMFDEILAKLAFPGIGDYLAKLLLYPLDVWSGLLPAGALVAYFALRRRVAPGAGSHRHFRTALLITGSNFLPYWLAPYSGVRYLIPIYPLFALIAAWLIWQAGDAAVRSTRRWLAATIAFSFALGLFIFPYYQHKFRGENYALAAADIISITQGQPLYVTDSSASGLNVAAYINQQRYPQQALQYPPEKLAAGFIIARTPDSPPAKIAKEYRLGGDMLYLLCRGAACEPGLPIK